jgi:dTDP-4-amino-4,6-dideoxygalactose transaminase
VTESVSDRLLRLPMYAGMEAGEISSVIDAVSSFFAKGR